MNSRSEKEKIRKILERDLVELDDPNFSINIVDKHIRQKEKERFKLFWNNDLIYAISSVILGLYSFSLWFEGEFSETFSELNIGIEHLTLITVTSFVFLLLRFFSEFFLVKTTLPKNYV